MMSVNIKYFPKKDLKGWLCWEPFTSVEIGLDGSVRMCSCARWMPTVIGNINDHSLTQLLSMPLANKIRKSIKDGSYEFCNEKTCGVINNPGGLVPIDSVDQSFINESEHFLSPYTITVAGDLVCNLSCPSCRRSVIKPKPEDTDTYKQTARFLMHQIFDSASFKPITLRLSTSGELFASPLLMNFVNDLPADRYPNLKLIIQTNGLLLPKNWQRLGVFQHRVKNLTITIDATCAETYAKLRRGGQWADLIKALSWIADHKNIYGYTINTRMIVQVDNYKEIVDFYHLSKSYSTDLIEYSRISNWASTPEEFERMDVLDPSHHEHAAAIHALSQVRQMSDVMIYG